uniref:Cation/H+ exchanger domain-containing protein n=1 Tax=Kalanchoe fedtschenkoi TaxID=63787 RepID=A0A7N0U5R4_KALFE
MIVMSGAMAFFGLIGLLYALIPESKLQDQDVWLLDYNELAFFLGFLPPVVYHAGAWGLKDHIVANYKSILVRSLVSKFISFATVSLGAALFLPKLGIDSLTTTDYLAIGAIFVPNNLIFAIPVVVAPKGDNYDQSGPMLADGVISVALSITLLKTIKGLDLSSHTILPRIILFALSKIGLVFVASSLLGIFIGWLASFHGLLAKNMNITPELVEDSNGNLVMGHEGATFILILLSVPTFLLAEFLSLSGTLSVFFYAITTTHYLWPTVTEESIIWKSDLHLTSGSIKIFLASWIGFAATRMIQWSYVASEPKTFTGVVVLLLTACLLGRVVSEYHLTRWGIGKSEPFEQTGNALFFNRWRLGNIVLESQFGSSEDSHRCLIFNCILVLYLFILLVFSVVAYSKWASSVCSALSIVGHFNLHSTTTKEEQGHEYVQIPAGMEQIV